MQTQKLYYEDCHLKTFCATVLSCEKTEKGFSVTLDKTAFYPEGGGQACDLGTLGDARVLDVREQGETVRHLCDRALPVGQTVEGTLDWLRRFDQMQQHTGEHIVSGILHRLLGAHNVGFHMGADVTTIDFDVAVPPELLPQIEKEANQAVFDNLPVVCGYPAQEVLPTIPYRSKKALPWPVRIVEVPGFDICACCGVHVERTGEIGMIKLLSCVKFHEGVRIEMVCGQKALSLLGRIYEQNRLVSQAFSAKLLETGAAAQKMNEALTAEKFRATGLERQLFDRIAKDFENAGNVALFQEGLLPASVRELADRIAKRCGGIAAVFSGDDENGYQVCLVCKDADVKLLGQAMNASLNGRGGGKPGFHQGSVKASKAQIESFLKENF